MLNKELITINQNSKQVLMKSKNLLDITKSILDKKDDDWIENLFKWADLNKIDSINFPRDRIKLLEIKVIKLYNCNLNSIPDEITKLTNLEFLELSYNNLTEIPKNLDELINLEFLSIAFNKLEKLPDKIVNLNSLNNFWMRGNPKLILNTEQKIWIKKIEDNGCYIY
jgi:Leucine-rich repeat (LRR) protein